MLHLEDPQVGEEASLEEQQEEEEEAEEEAGEEAWARNYWRAGGKRHLIGQHRHRPQG